MQDLAIVGMGLVGSAALRHATRTTSAVVGIGPPEPSDWAAHGGPFASHYDSGRVTRRLDARMEWAILASRAIAEYTEIEASSEISFHRATGMLFARHDEAGLKRLRDTASALDIPLEDGRKAAEAHGIRIADSATVLAEPAPAGTINPRAMVAAQHRAAKRNGALIARDAVMSIRPSLDGFELLTVAGRTHQARNVLVAAGAYTNSLAPQPLAVALRPEIVVLGEVTDAQAEELSDMPSVIHLLEHPELDDVYVNPPMTYPDGKTYIKIGGSQPHATTIEDTDGINRWMSREVEPHSLGLLRDVLVSLLPDVSFVGWQAKPCIITDTPTGLPYIDRLESGITVAFAGNGHAAKSADAVGAIAAQLALTGDWPDDELDESLFQAQFGTFTPGPGSRHGNR
ncbi:MAG: FAD-dependent oxidoreductase [Actinomycetota bacterium]